MNERYIFRLHITGPALERTVTLDAPGRTTVGRGSDNDIHLPPRKVTRHHARLDCTLETCSLTDLNSTNGTYHNGARLEPDCPTLLQDGDTIEIEPFKLRYEQRLLEVMVAPPAGASGDHPPVAPPPLPVAPPPLPIVPPSLSTESARLIHYLPEIYNTNFMRHFLAVFEAIWLPLAWNIDSFDLYLDPHTAPRAFLPWLAGWFGLTFDETWQESQRRELLSDAHRIYARLGTPWALARVLAIYTDTEPKIEEENQPPFTFTVTVPAGGRHVKRPLVEAIIERMKPAHTTYSLVFAEP